MLAETEIEKLMRYIGRSNFNDVMLKLRTVPEDINWEAARTQILLDYGWTKDEFVYELAGWISQTSEERSNDACVISQWINKSDKK